MFIDFLKAQSSSGICSSYQNRTIPGRYLETRCLFFCCLVSAMDDVKAEVWNIDQHGAEEGLEVQTLRPRRLIYTRSCTVFQTRFLQRVEVVQEQQSAPLTSFSL